MTRGIARRGSSRISLALLITLCCNGPGIAAHTPAPQAELLITGVTIADVDGQRFLDNQSIAVAGGKIAYVGDPAPAWQTAARVIDGRRMLALPGFVDTHTHLWQHVARGIEPAGRLQEWAPAVYKLAHHAEPGEVHDLTRAAGAQALLNGVTTVSDFASINFAESAVAETIAALREEHIGGAVIWWRPAVFLPWQLQDRDLKALRAQGGAELAVWVGFGPLSFMPLPMVHDGIQTARRNQLRMTEHAMENLTEARDFRAAVTKYLADAKLSAADRRLLSDAVGGPAMPKVDALMAMSRTRDDILDDPDWSAGLSPTERQALGALPAFSLPSQLRLLEAWGALDGFLAIHSVWPTQGDIDLYRAHGASVSHNPESNMYLSSGVAPLRRYRDAAIPVTLGTDGAASNDRINMFDAMRTAWMLQKVATLQPAVTRSLDSWFFLRAATINGAAALGIADRTGSLAPGKEADILLLDRDGLSVAPSTPATAAARLVTSAEARDLAYVIADGRVMVEHGHLVGQDEAALAADLTRIAAALEDREAHGKSWMETIALGPTAAQSLKRYRLIRTPDRVAIQLTNQRTRSVTVTVAFSGTTFGGKVPMTMHPASLARYPIAAPASFARYDIVLAPKETLSLEKPAGSAAYRLQHGQVTQARQAPAQEQVAIYTQ
jgi:5-methylthioadenosine/S-adenosylhomocysteine deaminase